MEDENNEAGVEPKKVPYIRLKPGHPPVDQLRVRYITVRETTVDYSDQMDNTVDPPVPLFAKGDIARMVNYDLDGAYDGSFDLAEIMLDYEGDLKLTAEIFDWMTGEVWSEPVPEGEPVPAAHELVGLADQSDEPAVA